MKEGNNLTRQRIFHLCGRAFELVAPMASKAQVLKFGWAVIALWDDMVHDHGVAGIELRRLAISTTVVIRFQQLPAQFSR